MGLVQYIRYCTEGQLHMQLQSDRRAVNYRHMCLLHLS